MAKSSTSRRGRGSRSAKSAKRGNSRRKKGSRTSGPAKKRTSKNILKFEISRDRKMDIAGLILVGSGLFTLLSIITPEQGVVTQAWIGIVRRVTGWGAVFVPLALLGFGLAMLTRRLELRRFRPNAERVVGAFLLFFASLIIMHAFVGGDDFESRLAFARDGRGGGVIGAALLSALLSALGSSGTIVVMLAWLMIAFTFSVGLSVPEIFELSLRTLRRIGAKTFRPRSKKATAPARSPASVPEKTAPAPPVSMVSSLPTPSSEWSESRPPPGGKMVWSLPAVEQILERGVEGKADAEFDQERGRLIEETLLSFGAPARVVEINRGPTITQFGVEPDYVEGRGGRRTKVKVSKISSLADDLALALAAPSIRIEAPVPGKGYIGVEVPNKEASLVSLRNVMEEGEFKKSPSKLMLGLGEDVSGKAVAADLSKMPHLLIAGTTGSGKSVCVNAIIACLLLQNTPEELRIVMIDPKRVELSFYNGIPHLLSPVIVELDRVVGALKWISREMDERYRRFAKAGVRNIAEFNQRMLETDQQGLPFLAVVIDELADLMMLAPDETERLITRMAQLARATGIHLIIATQRPSVDVVTGLIKANFPARIAFAVASAVDSRVILDQPGAERLLGRGDMLYQAPDASAPIRMQGSYVSEAELSRLIRYWKIAASGGEDAFYAPMATLPLNSPLEQVPLWNDVEEADEEKDAIYNEAVATVRSMRRGSISLLQRRLRIGYTRAARLVDQMEEEGIIGPARGGSLPREVLDYGDFIEVQKGD